MCVKETEREGERGSEKGREGKSRRESERVGGTARTPQSIPACSDRSSLETN